MDPMLVLAPLVNALWWLIPLALLVALLKSSRVKGVVGEQLVRWALRLRLDRATYRAFHDLTLPTPDGTTQIDHVVVSCYGIFVIETKNMKGWIFGGERQAQWTQKIYRHTTRFQNPLMQNYKHVKALQALLDVPPETVHSVVTFVGTSTFKTPMPENVTQGARFIGYIKSFREPVFSDAAIEAILQRIAGGRLKPGLATNRAHVQSLKTRADPLAERRCPKCGSALVLRTVKKGPRSGDRFWGCSTYPQCRVMQALG
ncbi:MAG: NERD domain-containing protein [Sphingobacteriia bacterium]|nr:NERD domain-containing protein [Sphingobacteriia bacterium]